MEQKNDQPGDNPPDKCMELEKKIKNLEERVEGIEKTFELNIEQRKKDIESLKGPILEYFERHDSAYVTKIAEDLNEPVLNIMGAINRLCEEGKLEKTETDLGCENAHSEV